MNIASHPSRWSLQVFGFATAMVLALAFGAFVPAASADICTAASTGACTPNVSIACTTNADCVAACNTCPDIAERTGMRGAWLCVPSPAPFCAPIGTTGHSCSFQCAPLPVGQVYRCEFACLDSGTSRVGTRTCRNSGDTAVCNTECEATCGSGNCNRLTVACGIGAPPAITTPLPIGPQGGPTIQTSGGGTQRGSSARLTNPLGVSTIQGLFSKIIRAAIGLAGSFALAVFVWGGVLWMTARGDVNQVKKAKSVLSQALIGLLLIFFSYTIISAFLNVFTTARL